MPSFKFSSSAVEVVKSSRYLVCGIMTKSLSKTPKQVEPEVPVYNSRVFDCIVPNLQRSPFEAVLSLQ